MRRKIRVYVDTSVFGGTQDEEFCEASRRFFEQVKRGEYVVLVSGTTLRELAGAPDRVRQAFEELPDESICEAPDEVEEEARALVRAYIAAGALGEAREADAMHVAVATVARADLLLSWNFRHIVNYDRIRKFNGVNALNGYPSIVIHSPLEVVYGDED